MANRIRTSFGGICAEESLKAGTLRYLREQTRERAGARRFAAVKQAAAAVASIAVIVSGAFSYKLYFTETAYVDLDVNPSVELTVNRLDRVIGAYPYNTDGADILEGMSVKHKDYKDAVGIVIDEMLRKGYTQDAELVSVTLQTNDKQKEQEMLSNIESAVMEHHGAAQLNAFPIDDNTRTAAHDVNISPAKYIAIMELQEVDPTATIDSCRGHSIVEIKRLTESHSGGHHGGSQNRKSGSDYNIENESMDDTENAVDSAVENPIPNNEANSGNGQNRHHGGGNGHGGRRGHN